MLALDLAPAAKDVVDVDEADRRKLILELAGYLLVADAVAELGGDPLAFLRIEEIEIGLGKRFRAVLLGNLVDDGDREFGKQAHRRDDALDLVGAVLLDDAARFSLEGDQDIAGFAFDERRRGSAATVSKTGTLSKILVM